MFRYKLPLFLIFVFWTISSESANIKGKISLDDTWAPVVYLSVIHSFEDLHTASYDLLRFHAEIDSSGYFEINGMDLEEEDIVYRLHICKNGDPVSTIMIGGQDENFIYFIMNKKSDITLTQRSDLHGFQGLVAKGHSAGNQLADLFSLQKKLNAPLDLPSAQNREFIKNQVLEDLQIIADTSSNPVIRLLAIHFIYESFRNFDQIKLMEKVQNDLAGSSYTGPYFESFSNRLGFLQFKAKQNAKPKYSWLKWLSLVLVIPLIILFLWRAIKHRSKKGNLNSIQKIQSLSNQEKKVFNLLKTGKSNKEISSELHIEVSTVKSHLHKIYTRLGVKSRKEIVNKDW